MAAYQAGDTVVHPQHGTAVVEGIVSRDTGEGPVSYLELWVTSAGMKIMVPEAGAAEVGIREPCTREEADAILSLLEDSSEVSETWKERSAANTARVKTTGLAQMAMVVRDLNHHEVRAGKPLNAGERTMLDRCLRLLGAELALALEMTLEQTLALIAERSAVGSATPPSGQAVAEV